VIDVMTEKRRAKSSTTGIYSWANQRLEDPLHALDVGGVIWGMGRWFGAAVERAGIFHRLDMQYNQSSASTENGKTETDDPELTLEKTVRLSRYLEMTQLPILGVRGKKVKPKALLIWNIGLGWAGSVTSNIEISVGSVPPNAEAGFKQIFSSLVPSKGVMGAFESVWEMINKGADDERSVEGPRGKRKRA